MEVLSDLLRAGVSAFSAGGGGGFGLGASDLGVGEVSTDLNAVNTTRFGAWVFGTTANVPNLFGGYGIYLNIQYSATPANQAQFAVGLDNYFTIQGNNTPIYLRHCIDGVWSKWQQHNDLVRDPDLNIGPPSGLGGPAVRLTAFPIGDLPVVGFLYHTGAEGSNGREMALQPHMGVHRVMSAIPVAGTTTLSTFGVVITATGTATLAAVAPTGNSHTRMRRLDYLVTTAAATAVAGFRSSTAFLYRGPSVDGVKEGFVFRCTWGPATGVANAAMRAFVGLRASIAAPTDVQPSTLVDCIGAGWDSADANIQIICNGASGAATKVDTGIAVPTDDRSVMYRLSIHTVEKGGSNDVVVSIEDHNGVMFTTTLNTGLPSVSKLLGVVGYCSAGGVSSVVGISLSNLYIETFD